LKQSTKGNTANYNNDNNKISIHAAVIFAIATFEVKVELGKSTLRKTNALATNSLKVLKLKRLFTTIYKLINGNV